MAIEYHFIVKVPMSLMLSGTIKAYSFDIYLICRAECANNLRKEYQPLKSIVKLLQHMVLMLRPCNMSGNVIVNFKMEDLAFLVNKEWSDLQFRPVVLMTLIQSEAKQIIDSSAIIQTI
ncbi:hypothetical protein NPIL_295641 [Nephila pilipes]|uniref:Uncharacterized protein n=1 Tax=Nephila pilipes TaxID=299642 RepID=A0A8X6URT1_NEPPI|nr:hypothetical protein NPIL_295641 [Nephila pilipes]